jgi:hypothetical protein
MSSVPIQLLELAQGLVIELVKNFPSFGGKLISIPLTGSGAGSDTVSEVSDTVTGAGVGGATALA